MILKLKYGTFLFFGCWVLIGAIFVWFFVPETSGLLLEDMDILFNTKGLARTKRKETDRIIAARGTESGDVRKAKVELVETA
jgi:hypothetical protein